MFVKTYNEEEVVYMTVNGSWTADLEEDKQESATTEKE